MDHTDPLRMWNSNFNVFKILNFPAEIDHSEIKERHVSAHLESLAWDINIYIFQIVVSTISL